MKYNGLTVDAHPLIHEKVIKRMPPSPAVILDVGCGEGAFLARLRDVGYNAVGCDIDEAAIHHARGAGLVAKYADINHGLPYDTGSMDAVVVIEVIEHIHDPWALVAECYRVLRPGGIVVITTPNIMSIYSRLLFFRRGTPALFGESDRGNGHFMPRDAYQLENALKGKFEISEITCNQSFTRNTECEVPYAELIYGALRALYPMLKYFMKPRDKILALGQNLIVVGRRIEEVDA